MPGQPRLEVLSLILDLVFYKEIGWSICMSQRVSQEHGGREGGGPQAGPPDTAGNSLSSHLAPCTQVGVSGCRWVCRGAGGGVGVQVGVSGCRLGGRSTGSARARLQC